MKRTSTIMALLLSAAASVFGQVIIDESKVPAPGTMFINYDADVNTSFTFSKSGSANTWDFNFLGTPVLTDTVFYLAPQQVIKGEDFPNATIAKRQTGEKRTYFASTEASGVYFQGVTDDFLNNGYYLSVPLENQVLIQPFPIMELTNYENLIVIKRNVNGSEVGQQGGTGRIRSREFTYASIIASGTISIPSGTYPAILERKVTSTMDTVELGSEPLWIPLYNSSTTDTIYSWYTNESAEPFAKVVYSGGVVTKITFHKNTVTGIAANKSVRSVTAYPNPARDIITFAVENDKAERISVSNATGNEVLTAESNGNMLDVSGLKEGVYAARIFLKNGKVLVSTFVKN